MTIRSVGIQMGEMRGGFLDGFRKRPQRPLAVTPHRWIIGAVSSCLQSSERAPGRRSDNCVGSARAPNSHTERRTSTGFERLDVRSPIPMMVAPGRAGTEQLRGRIQLKRDARESWFHVCEGTGPLRRGRRSFRIGFEVQFGFLARGDYGRTS